MYQSLVNKNSGRVVQIIKGGSDVRFDVHEDFIWIDGPYELPKGTDAPDFWYNFEDREVKRRVPPPAPYDLSRRLSFETIQNQLDMLYHDMEQGLIPGKESSTWFAHVKSVKEQHPKP